MVFRRDPHVGRKIAIGSAIAGGLGYLAGILTAPKSGKDTRRDIADKAGDAKAFTMNELDHLNEELKELISTTKARGATLSASARAEFNEAVIKAKDAQNKAAEVLKAVRKGEASDPELNRAIKQAKQATKNLGKYLKT
jgi:gas vesicle protein